MKSEMSEVMGSEIAQLIRDLCLPLRCRNNSTKAVGSCSSPPSSSNQRHRHRRQILPQQPLPAPLLRLVEVLKRAEDIPTRIDVEGALRHVLVRMRVGAAEGEAKRAELSPAAVVCGVPAPQGEAGIKVDKFFSASGALES
eukprot:CAMPEP_0173174648 /NCGR_PEP_ID=MMETSP1141-20130122/3467_1 /TAXON_ID=483371 /ORGANISM="non described non described, Strain CCMP2298" /LENGTH=140 /DNA_ID=CAMNT_0014096791 /DNA_START=596 /DNA_END=1018 /DNA_ORIENTATION=+